MILLAKNKKPRTIGEMTNSRGEWIFNPVTRVEKDKKKYDRKKKNYRNEDE